MRLLMLITVPALLLAACGSDDAGNQSSPAAQDLNAQTIDSNDMTAIDAATGADANMAEDVELTVNELSEENLDASDDENTLNSAE